MSHVPKRNLLLFPGTLIDSVSDDRIAPKYLTCVVVAECRKSCDKLAETLDVDLTLEHETINDCLAACDEFLIAAARGSKHILNYAIWCVERCDDLLADCIKIDTHVSRSTAKWLKAVSTQLNQEVIAFDPFASSEPRGLMQSADGTS